MQSKSRQRSFSPPHIAAMEDSVEETIPDSVSTARLGPEVKEYNLLRADEEYNNGNVEYSIYYQVKAHQQGTDLRYLTESEENVKPSSADIMRELNPQEEAELKNNKFLANLLSHASKKAKAGAVPKNKQAEDFEYLNLLKDEYEPSKGFARIVDICNQLPDEWCVVQLCKSFNTNTTYSGFCEIFANDGSIYLTLLRHCRSPTLGPISLRLNNADLSSVFQKYSTLVERFRSIIAFDINTVKDSAFKQKYWKDLNQFESFLQDLIVQLRSSIEPYAYLFLGKRYNVEAVEMQTKKIYKEVDSICKKQRWSTYERILLSQAALHANKLSANDYEMLCYEIARQDEVKMQMIHDFLKNCAKEWQDCERQEQLCSKRFPTILIIEERLDHFNWEQLYPTQEITRFKSLHCLWRLYQYHKAHIKHGYYVVNIKQGMCVVNPEGDLPNSGRRLRSFFKYWLPHWTHLIETVPSEDVIINRAFKADCFCYAGHGSGLQYINAKVICRTCVKGVVFLFGCDSTRLLCTGLFGAMYGSHNYYHGAFCPTVVGTLMPALDANIDSVSVNMLSRWLAPETQQVIPWCDIDYNAWATTGTVKAKTDEAPTLAKQQNYHFGSLCSVLSYVHQGLVEKKLYNYTLYVSRGLPAWNEAVERLPLFTHP